MSRDRRRALTPEERVLWNTVAKTVAPLRADTGEAIEPEGNEPCVSASARAAPTVKPRGKKPVALPIATPPPLAPLGRRLRQRVSRGKAAIDARLDLHGLTQSEAHARLLGFLRSASARGLRLVLVITGKGERGASEGGVLRRQLPHWLALPEFRALVIGFEQAHTAHGGEGAWYISVRRSRERE